MFGGLFPASLTHNPLQGAEKRRHNDGHRGKNKSRTDRCLQICLRHCAEREQRFYFMQADADYVAQNDAMILTFKSLKVPPQFAPMFTE